MKHLRPRRLQSLRRSFDTQSEGRTAYEKGDFFFTGRRRYKAIIRDIDLTELGQPWPADERERLRVKGRESCGQGLRQTIDPDVSENTLEGETGYSLISVSDNVKSTRQTRGVPSMLNLERLETSCFGAGLQMDLTWQREYTGTEVTEITNKETGEMQVFEEGIKSRRLTGDDNNKQRLYPPLSEDWAAAQKLLESDARWFDILREQSDRIEAGNVPLEHAFGNAMRADENSVTVTYEGPAFIGAAKEHITENQMEITLTITKD